MVMSSYTEPQFNSFVYKLGLDFDHPTTFFTNVESSLHFQKMMTPYMKFSPPKMIVQPSQIECPSKNVTTKCNIGFFAIYSQYNFQLRFLAGQSTFGGCSGFSFWNSEMLRYNLYRGDLIVDLPYVRFQMSRPSVPIKFDLIIL